MISSSARVAGPYAGTGSQTVFPFSFKVFQNADVLVLLTSAAGVITTLALTSAYSVALNSNQDTTPGGAVTLLSAPAAGYTVTISSQVQALQASNLTNAGNFYPSVINNALDYLTILVQQLYSLVAGALRFPLGDAGTNTVLPGQAARANNLLGFDANGNPVAVAPAAQSATALQNLLAALGGSALIGFIQSGIGAVMRSLQSELRDVLKPAQFGARGDGSDDTAALAALFTAVQNGQTIDLCGKSYAVFVGVPGTLAGTDAIALAALPRLFGKSNILIRNGAIYAANPAVSGTKLNFPSTFTVDGCTDIHFSGVTFKSKGESYGYSDNSQPLTSEQRRLYLAQNGGHACVVIRSNKVYFDTSCRFEKAGSVGAFYSTSSDEIVCNEAYASAESLGYAAFAADSWCGTSATSGFARHRVYLNNCRSDNNGATYGSKGCVDAEDSDTYVYVNGGTWKDAYANGSANQLGAAFIANTSHVYVDGPCVENCAALGLSTNSGASDTILEIFNAKARGLRTSMHVVDNTSFGQHKIKYRNCDAEIVGTSLWGAGELSRSTVVANMKVSTTVELDIVDCRTNGAHTFSLNLKGVYGGLRVLGGHHTVTDRIFDSAGWGGSGAGSLRGYEVLAGAVFRVLLANTSVISNALSNAASNLINVITNKDPANVFTYQYLNFDKTVSVYSNAIREFISLMTQGSGLSELQLIEQVLSNCYQTVAPGRARVSSVRVVSLDGVSGSLYKATLGFQDSKNGNTLTFQDDALNSRRSQGTYSGPTLVGTELQYGVYLNTATTNLTVGGFYPASFAS